MNELPSTEFRKRFARLTEGTVVTVNGHVIGEWWPKGAMPVASNTEAGVVSEARLAYEPTPQAKRDELLGKINRGK